MKRSLVNKTLIRVVMLPKSLYRRMGVQTDHLTTILEMKLSLDDRRSRSFMQKNNDDEDPNPSYAAFTLLSYLLMGALYILPIITINNTATALTISFGMMMFFLAATLISDFTTVLIDVRDNVIILPRPISDRTFLLSRLLHIVIYISKVIIPMSIPTFITIVIMKGFYGALVYTITLPFLILFTIFAVNAAYLLILRITTPDKFKSIITSIQVVFAIIVYAGYQLLPRLMNKAILESYSLPEKFWTLLIPPYWFAAEWQVLFERGGTPFMITAAITAVLLPVILLWFVVKVFAPSFNRKLGLITGSEGTPTPARSKKSNSFAPKLSRLISRTPAEQMGFEFTWLLSARMRDFKLKTYPSMGYLLVLMIIMVVPRKGVTVQTMITMLKEQRFILLTLLYLSSFILITAMSTSRYTEKHNAAWIFNSSPIATPGEVIAGSIKAMIVKFFLPFVLLVSAFLIAATGWYILPDVVLAFTNQLLLIYIMAFLSAMKLPFSLPLNQMEKGTGFLKTLVSLLVIGILVTLHYLVKFLPAAAYFLIPATLLGCVILEKNLYRVTWQQLRK